MKNSRSMAIGFALLAASRLAVAAAPATEADEYTRYELLAPGSSQFHIAYEVTATSPGAEAFFNPIRKGSEASGESVVDLASGQPLAFDVVAGPEARRGGLVDAEDGVSYIRVKLARPVPRDGGARLRIEKTYRDVKSYSAAGDTIVFSRSLGIRRNAIVLPAGYELTECNIPAQVFREPDGRIRVSFMNVSPDAASVVVRGRKLP
ncbi:MAG: hypothetical protein ACRD16_16070 [Thermoanaerobaculia bacterium]